MDIYFGLEKGTLQPDIILEFEMEYQASIYFLQ